jgi:ubiquinone/menaquinone biosynthesis C-methylase UbiE
LSSLVQHLEIFLSSPRIFNLTYWIGAGGLRATYAAVEREAHLTIADCVLDVCCGTGIFALLVPGKYVGLDLNHRYVTYCQQRYGADQRRSFIVGDATAVSFRRKAFDVTFLISSLHHFSDEIAIQVLRQVAELTRKRVIVVDPSPETRRPISRFLLTLDRGEYIRSVEQQRELLARGSLSVQRHYTLYAGFAHQRMFVCIPA